MKHMTEDERSAQGAPAPKTLDGCDLVIDGEHYRYLAVSVPSAALPSALTAAERDVATRAAHGQSAQDIAAARGSSRRTVDHQLASIYRKLGIASRSELAVLLADAEAQT
jgi:DNA-binding CsgD family transcriptional regulator